MDHDRPEVLPSGEWILDAFASLSTCRAIGFSVGPIPWSVIMDYADRAGLDSEAALLFNEAVRELDREYLRWIEAEAKKRQTKGADRAGQGEA